MMVKSTFFVVILCLINVGKTNAQNATPTRDSLVKKVPSPSFRSPLTTRNGPYSIEPIFKTPEDSLKNVRMQELFNAFGLGTTKNQRDSLNKLLKEVRISGESVIGTRKVYRGSEGFTPFTSADHNDIGSVKKVSIYREKRIPKNLYLCEKLESLEIVDCSIKKLPGKLRKLPIRSIHIFNDQSKKGIKFSKNNSITKVVNRNYERVNLPRRIHKIRKLEKVDFSSCGLVYFPSSIFKSKTIKECYLSQNKIDIANYQFPRNLSLEKLDISKNKITVVPASIGNLAKLKTLQLNHNEIEVVQYGIGKLENLVELSFYQNKISSVPPDFYNLKKLVELDFYHNKLEKLDDSILNWQNMQILYLSYNNLVSVPPNILKLSNLRELYLHNNKLSALPMVEPHLPNLKILRLNNNYFLNLPDMIPGLSKLENLDLSYNNLRVIPEELWKMKNLKLLSLVSNPWTESTRTMLNEKAELLRQQEVIVNLSELREDSENN